MCIVITQGRRILGQMTYPHKYPFISALRNITEFAVPLTLHKSDVIAYNEKGQKITQITSRTQLEYERVFQPEIDEDVQEMEPQPLQQTQSLEISDQSTFQDKNDKISGSKMVQNAVRYKGEEIHK
ncbi:MAG: hypothetical protein EZS28_027074 [Streblomastix strix]|uniref:Uncharacterized protein n=1 Tax=Streblomastix strix TaxID=222440 RepID=A0A5J4V3S5_9EUKA|nr:MAG: hypothetical protein EZS28_027074 [Streblomastix strix]